MNNQITDELQSFLKDYAADPTPRDFAIAQHFYDLALNDVKTEAWRLLEESPISATACIKLTSLVKFINNQKSK